MAWSTSIPAVGNTVSSDLAAIRDNFAALQSTIGQDHYYPGQTNDGLHQQVTIVALTPATPVSGAGILYVSNVDNELYYAYPTGGSWSTIQLTQNGTPAGAADAFVSFKGSDGSIYGTAKNITVTRNSKANYTLTLTGMSSANYTVCLATSDYTPTTSHRICITSKSQTELVISGQISSLEPAYIDVTIFQV